jgi:hypothetical protein
MLDDAAQDQGCGMPIVKPVVVRTPGRNGLWRWGIDTDVAAAAQDKNES